MDKLKSLEDETHNKKLGLFIIGAGIAGLNTFFGRADYNLFIYLYMAYIWKFMDKIKDSQTQEKLATFYAVVYSFFIDIFWCIYWRSKWNNLKEDPESTIHGIVIFLSWIGVLLKICVVGLVSITEWNIIKSSLPQKLQEKLNPEYAPQVDELNQM